MGKLIKITDDLRRRVQHVHEAYGKSYPAISAESGIGVGNLHKIIYGTGKAMMPDNHQRLCAYLDSVESTSREKITPPARSVGYLKRRIERKMYRLISAESGISISIIQRIMSDKLTAVSVPVWDALALWVNDGGSKKMKSRHKKQVEKQPAISRSAFASAFSSVLKQRDISYQALADMIGVSYASIRNYAIGDRLPCRRVLMKIKEVLPEIIQQIEGR